MYPCLKQMCRSVEVIPIVLLLLLPQSGSEEKTLRWYYSAAFAGVLPLRRWFLPLNMISE